jgi:hypothetical protein
MGSSTSFPLALAIFCSENKENYTVYAVESKQEIIAGRNYTIYVFERKQ